MKIVLLIAVVLLSSCKTGDATAIKRNGSRVEALGWYHGSCIASDKELAQEDRVILVNKDQKKVEAKIAGSGLKESCAPIMEGRAEINQTEGYRFYKVSSNEQAIPEEELGVVVVLPLITKQESLDTNNNNVEDVVSYCTTAEGVRFYLWDEEKGEKRPFWQAYYYLGYDIEADCEFDSL